MVIDGVLGSPLLFVLVVLPQRCCFECLHSPRVPTLEKSPFRRTRASDVGAALPCLRPGFPILASRQSRRQIEASIDRGQSSRTHATGHAIESPSRLRWQPRIIVRYSRGPQPRRNTKWRRPRYTLSSFIYARMLCSTSAVRSNSETGPKHTNLLLSFKMFIIFSTYISLVRMNVALPLSGLVITSLLSIRNTLNTLRCSRSKENSRVSGFEAANSRATALSSHLLQTTASCETGWRRHSSPCKYFPVLGSFVVSFVLPLTRKGRKLDYGKNMRSIYCAFPFSFILSLIINLFCHNT